ncbi:hypothetical protein GE061_009702 [Apolygus lucorum]|uniref:Uncharacterized protein n=1 Tax=Apolygus lucorum TaxID=248454 RepID=A0A6A4K442_APOLU|nr:hypothetical protein GE061_009702 [Apolygus lucorum]
MILGLVVSVLMLVEVGIATTGTEILDAMLEYYLQEANDYIKSNNLGTYYLPDGSVDLPDHVSNPRIYDLSSWRRKAVLVEYDDKGDMIVTLIVMMDTLVFQADIHNVLSGHLRMHLTGNYFHIALGLNFNDTGCSAWVSNVDVGFPGMYVDVWGLTQLGDDKAKDKVRDSYNSHHHDWENTLKEKIRPYLDEFLKKNPVCQQFFTIQQTGLLDESIAQKYFNFDPFPTLNNTLFSFR